MNLTNCLKFTIVIPTRNRAETLYHTLRTCVSQKYVNFEIIVSDNNSADNTKDVVDSFNDNRIRYINTQNSIGMSSNWEFALAYVTGDYVMYLGDDDGLLDNSIEHVSNILTQNSYPALIWQKSNYNWPDIVKDPNELSILLTNKIYILSVKPILHLISRGLTSFGRIPSVYSGFVSVNIINKIKSKNDNFFDSVTPDIYSGLAVMSEIDKYIYSLTPFSVSGGSNKSNGYAISSNYNNKLMKLFFEEMDVPQHDKMRVIPGTITSQVFEAILQVNDKCFDGKLKIWKKKFYSQILKEISVREPKMYANALSILNSISFTNSERRQIDFYIKKYPNSYRKKSNINKFLEGGLIINGNDFEIYNIYDACKVVSKIIPESYYGKAIKKFTFVDYLVMSFLRSKG
jgi:glycosyltransferase involved in cell wall biosynthesis